ncbi:M20 family metallo-hydrolase [Jeotgalibacillus salarius]|uniref:Zn-dependent hydrolase n=1 Tax=Jeotgalibacillus salarius TaxID=546023 RepID=A0A4Y8LHZ2_9BACL|nr:M20 family metallo-hydrolase [Jeotgalibacillus salarius]TFE01787.1 Zn-dependent hydrolase [Jeotgalibacillus salarius]
MQATTSFSKLLLSRLLHQYPAALDRDGVSGKRVAQRLAELSRIGLTKEQGSNRMSFSDEERAAKELVKVWMKEAGLSIYEDGAGNVFGTFQGNDQSQSVMSGSHLDSVPNGGHFDGPLGVLASLEVAQAWRETGYIPETNYEVVIFTDEEGARFNGGLTGSRAMAGEVDMSKQVKLTDYNGTFFEKVLEQHGLSLKNFSESKRSLDKIKAYVEVHIEQGKQLEQRNLSTGVVTGIAGPSWLTITFDGDAGHAGNTPMVGRKDPLVAAGEFVYRLKDIPGQVSSSGVATVGKLEVSPNGVNVIPGQVKLTADIRDIDEGLKDQIVEKTRALINEIEKKHEVKIDVQETLKVTPVKLSTTMQKLAAESTAHVTGEKAFHLPSGAGHDAMVMGRYVPTAMLFTNSKDGVSHNPKEWSSLEHCVETIHVLKHLLEKIDQTDRSELI